MILKYIQAVRLSDSLATGTMSVEQLGLSKMSILNKVEEQRLYIEEGCNFLMNIGGPENHSTGFWPYSHILSLLANSAQF